MNATCPKCGFTAEVVREGEERCFFVENERKVYLRPVRTSEMCLHGFGTFHCPVCEYDPLEIDARHET